MYEKRPYQGTMKETKNLIFIVMSVYHNIGIESEKVREQLVD